MKKISEEQIIFKPVQVTFLEMHERPDLVLSEKENVSIEKIASPISVDDYRTLYFSVGEKWNWLDRMVMNDEELFEKINWSNIEIFVIRFENAVAGYVELLREKDFGEIVYFGLFPSFIGKGIGKYFLQWSILKLWGYEVRWIQLNTCTLDHECALETYLKAGFKIVNIHTEPRRVLQSS